MKLKDGKQAADTESVNPGKGIHAKIIKTLQLDRPHKKPGSNYQK